MRLTLEAAVLFARNEIDVRALPQYFTKAMMPLDRDCHREMSAAWGTGRQQFAAVQGHVINRQFQALPLIRQTWLHGTQKNVIANAWRKTGLYPWSPSELLATQALALFRNTERPDKDAGATAADALPPSAHPVLTLPPALNEAVQNCNACSRGHLGRFHFCPHCGAASESPRKDGGPAMRRGAAVERNGSDRTPSTWTPWWTLASKGSERPPTLTNGFCTPCTENPSRSPRPWKRLGRP